jgi:pyridoxal phosphate enzyme (YggS family)
MAASTGSDCSGATLDQLSLIRFVTTDYRSPNYRPLITDSKGVIIMTTIAENFARIKDRIHKACSRVNRDPSSIHLVGVTKTVAVDRVREGVLAGITILGENYVQEARKKREILGDLSVEWHFIGHLQSNKAKVAVDCFDYIHTLDREKLARELDRQAQKRGKQIPVLIQINVGDEATKSGTSFEEALSLFRSASSMDALVVRGLMALPPYLEDPEQVRPYFRQLRQILEQLREMAPQPEILTELSMGMSHDFEVAIEEGATLIRVGTALFGSRPV